MRLNFTNTIRFSAFGMMSIVSLLKHTPESTIIDHQSDPVVVISLPSELKRKKAESTVCVYGFIQALDMTCSI
jgi:hypothetical protein